MATTFALGAESNRLKVKQGKDVDLYSAFDAPGQTAILGHRRPPSLQTQPEQ